MFIHRDILADILYMCMCIKSIGSRLLGVKTLYQGNISEQQKSRNKQEHSKKKRKNQKSKTNIHTWYMFGQYMNILEWKIHRFIFIESTPRLVYSIALFSVVAVGILSVLILSFTQFVMDILSFQCKQDYKTIVIYLLIRVRINENIYFNGHIYMAFLYYI